MAWKHVQPRASWGGIFEWKVISMRCDWESGGLGAVPI